MLPSFSAWSQSPPPKHPPSSSHDRKDQPKKPRHRHSAFQLAALNELYDKNEHPSLEERTSLAERLGMETKTVNSWFQNKRASSKKRHKGPAPAPCELPPISALIASVSAPAVPLPSSEYDELSEEEHLSSRLPHSAALDHHPRHQSLFFTGHSHQRHLFETESAIPRKMRSRPSPAQTEELRKLYDVNPHPSKEEREELGDRIGMRYQSVSNWFQNQRSVAKKRKQDEDVTSTHTYSAFPPTASASHPSLAAAVPPARGHPSIPSSLAALPRPHRARRSPSLAPSGTAFDSRPSSPRASPYRTSSSTARPRRTRPEPHQLEALKKLFHRTSTPSIEERGAIALEIGMDVGKVTNWFRNLRQTARKRASRQRGDGDDDFDDGDIEMEDREEDADDISLATYTANSRSVSRAGTPPLSATPSPPTQEGSDTVADRPIRVKLETDDKQQRRMYANALHANSHSDVGSDEEYQEAVTPSPEASPPPHREVGLEVGPLSYADLEKATTKFRTGVKVEDALLLLSFHHHVVH